MACVAFVKSDIIENKFADPLGQWHPGNRRLRKVVENDFATGVLERRDAVIYLNDLHLKRWKPIEVNLKENFVNSYLSLMTNSLIQVKRTNGIST